MFGLFDDLLEKPLIVLQAGDFGLVVGHRPREAHAFVPKGRAGGMRHHH